MPDINMIDPLEGQPRPDNHEAAMARADLYKLHEYSKKLFKIINEGDELEGWVQAKITKAADYIASVFHYMEYEMKFTEFGDKLENAGMYEDVYTESVLVEYKKKLTEARIKLEKLKKKNVKQLEDDISEEVSKVNIPAAQRKAKGGDWKVSKADLEKEAGKSPTSKSGLDAKKKTLGMKEEVSKVNIPAAQRKAKGGDWKVTQQDLDKDDESRISSKAGLEKLKKKVGVKEAAKPDFLDVDKDGNKKEPFKKAVSDKKMFRPKGK